MASRPLPTCAAVLVMFILCGAQSPQRRYRLDLSRCSGPQWNIGSFSVAGAANCTAGPAYDPSAIDSLRSELNTKWPACGASSGTEALYSTAWESHGRCTGLEQLSYFNDSLHVYDRNSKYCSTSPGTGECFFCVDDRLMPIARALCNSPTPGPPGPPPTPSPPPSPSIRTLKLQFEKCAGSPQWSIHGLWPEWGLNCTGPSFDLKELAAIAPALQDSWRTCPEYNSTYTKFWGHEWNTHGSCTGWSELSYFNTTLMLFNKHVGSCPPQSSAKSCSFCFNASNLSTVLDHTQCHLSQTVADVVQNTHHQKH